MTYPLFSKTLSSSLLLFTTLYAPLTHAADVIPDNGVVTPSTFVGIVDDSKNSASELVRAEQQSAVLGEIAPTARVSTSELNKALEERQPIQTAKPYDIEALKADPKEFTRFLNLALAAQDMQTVKELLPVYKSIEIQDPMLIKFADALVYRSNGENKKAIAIYKGMLADNPDFHPVRLNLARALYADKQYAAAQNQLNRLRGADLPEPIMQTINGLIERIDEQEQWKFNASLSYVSEDNLNNVPDTFKPNGYNPVDKEEGHGVQASASASKRFNLPNNYYATVGGNAFAKAFWDANEYNDYLLTASAGLGYDDAKNDVSITPFITKRIYSDDPYSWRKGVTLKASRWIAPKFKLTATGIISNEKYDEEEDKARETDGRFIGLNGLYLKDAKEYFYAGFGHYQNDVPKSSIISYDRNSLNIGWGREWNKGISTLATVGYAQKEYDSPSDDLSGGGLINYYNTFGGPIGSSREDKTRSIGLQVWKRDFAWHGLTPRLVFDYDKTTSNFGYYDDRDDKSATVLLTKTF